MQGGAAGPKHNHICGAHRRNRSLWPVSTGLAAPVLASIPNPTQSV
jgi:hypothetical protein